MAKDQGFLVTLQWDPAGGTAYSTIGQIMDINGPEVSRDEIEVTTRDSTEYWMEFIKGMKNGGNVTFGVVLDLSLATHGTASTGMHTLRRHVALPVPRTPVPAGRRWPSCAPPAWASSAAATRCRTRATLSRWRRCWRGRGASWPSSGTRPWPAGVPNAATRRSRMQQDCAARITMSNPA